MARIPDEAVAQTGLLRRLLAKELALTKFLAQFASVCQQNKQEWALFGGTAINKLYLGGFGRFSEDADFHLFAATPAKAFAVCKKISGCEAKGIKRIFRDFYRIPLVYADAENGVESDIINFDANLSLKKPRSEIVYKKMTSLLDTYGVVVPALELPTYPPQTLVAMKLLAISGRAAGKDLYDLYHLLRRFEASRSQVMGEAYAYKNNLFDFQRFGDDFIERARDSINSVDGKRLTQYDEFILKGNAVDWRVVKRELKRLMTLKLLAKS